ncbi:MAG: undecaprenyl-diphosphatase UppP [Candidatus Blackburnbacteria bacterium RIFCSPHIGHO2_01_FULL_43_15b]|uniref:Undecaprenyl-diphosphatase n=1 Tax=Candidatus Blackburnbacteria bacterium RIFCSPHIGHO2_01_FULL_43_15b TaxID=1797513 RepID=A0A1G1UY66_9BACT|nr:MAG: undecaprenyl-diphosphatase UppP [Candidatus Blackburnbacteria bacterium RIFCSPHIGHO2_01_FULL_43_15b]
MEYFQAIILSVVEGLTEFLPVSSTGHLVLTANILNIPQTDFVKSFEIIIQLGAIAAIIFLYGKTLLTSKRAGLRILTAFLPTAFLGFFLYKYIKSFLIGNTNITLLALFFGGIALIVLEFFHQEKEQHVKKVEDLSFKQSFLIGVCQSLSVVPGVSRAAATILGGLFVGARRKVAVEFSFLLAVPTMLAASGLDIVKSDFALSEREYLLLATGFMGSFLVAIIAVKFLLKFIQTHTFIPFGIYRIFLALLFWIFLIG